MGKTKENPEYDHVEIAHVIAERLEELAGTIQQSRELMNAQEAADFLRMPYSEFRKVAPVVPRHAISERRFIYRRSELLEWALSQ